MLHAMDSEGAAESSNDDVKSESSVDPTFWIYFGVLVAVTILTFIVTAASIAIISNIRRMKEEVGCSLDDMQGEDEEESMMLMRLQGMLETPSTRLQRILGLLRKGFFLYLTTHFVLICMLAIIVGDNPYHVKLETCSGMLPGMSMAYRHYLFALNEKPILALMQRMRKLVLEVVDAHGAKETIVKWDRLGYIIMCISTFLVFFVTVPAYLYSYYTYFTVGIVTAPYEVFIPFEREHNIHGVVLYEAISFSDQALTMVVSNTFIATLVIVVTGVTVKISERFRQLGLSTVSAELKQTIDWHAEIVMITEDINSLFGSVFMVDCLLSIMHISVSGYLLIKVGLETGSNLHKYLFLNLMNVTIPSFFCILGHVVALQNDKLQRSMYQNEWYQLTPKIRNNLVLPLKMASVGMSLSYRRAIDFNLATYLAILKQCYSFLAVLKLMDGQK